MLHSFWFDASAQAFAAVTQMDPGCAMGYWGRPWPRCSVLTRLRTPTAKTSRRAALSWSRRRRQAQDPAGARVHHGGGLLCQDRARPTRARAWGPTPRPWNASSGLPGGSERHPLRPRADITAAPADKTYATSSRPRGSRDGLRSNESPGRCALPDHSYDYPPIAHRGLSAARRYAGIARPRHMPAHARAHLHPDGFWQESIESNRASAAAAKNHFDQLHAIDYLAYAYLQESQTWQPNAS